MEIIWGQMYKDCTVDKLLLY